MMQIGVEIHRSPNTINNWTTVSRQIVNYYICEPFVTFLLLKLASRFRHSLITLPKYEKQTNELRIVYTTCRQSDSITTLQYSFSFTQFKASLISMASTKSGLGCPFIHLDLASTSPPLWFWSTNAWLY